MHPKHLAVLSLSLCTLVAAQNLNFQVYLAPYINYFIRDNTTAATLLLTAPNATSGSVPQRLVVAMPAGNAGCLSYFLPTDNSTQLEIALVNNTLATTSAEYNQTGITAQVTLSADADLGYTSLGAIRAVRDYVEGNGLTHLIFNYTVVSANSTDLVLHRQYINGTLGMFLYYHAENNLALNVTLSSNATLQPTVRFSRKDSSQAGTLSFTVTTNDTVLEGLSTSDDFLTPAQVNASLSSTASGLADGSNANAVQFSFLTYTSKLLAGSWRFLTYFMIAVNLLLPLLTGSAIEASLGSVIERTNSTGALCHEETIGDYASFINIQNNQSYLGGTPFYDYKMIDTDILLLPTLAKYFLETPSGSGRAQQFLARNSSLMNGTYMDLLNRNIQYNLGRAAAFAQDQVVENLLHLREGQPVGQWRDSNAGLGYGTIPFDCNVVLLPATLRAIADLSNAGILNSSLAANASQMAAVWETQAAPFFRYNLSQATAEQRLNNFVQQANLSTSLLSSANSTSSSNLTYLYALSLNDDGTPVQVQNSDLGFSLYFGSNVSAEIIQATVDALQPYPVGLLTPIGMLVANPAYDSNTTNIDVFNRAAYHGTVVWSWQQALMLEGINRQLGLCSNATAAPTWCSALSANLTTARENLLTSINGAPAERYSEVWSYGFDQSNNSFSVVDLGSLSLGTESDAVQLWSYAFLALQDSNSTAGAT